MMGLSDGFPLNPLKSGPPLRLGSTALKKLVDTATVSEDGMPMKSGLHRRLASQALCMVLTLCFAP